LRERDAIVAELDMVREAVQTARSETGARLGAADDERAAIERALKEAEARAHTAIRDRDMVAEELEMMRESLASVQSDAQAQLEEVQQAAARRIADLEIELREGARQQPDANPEPAMSTLEAARNARAIRPDDTVFAEPTLAPAPPPPPAPARAGKASAVPPASPVRRAGRHAFHEDMQILIDGSPATLVDLSITGAQVISQAALKPNRQVRLQLPADDAPITCKGKVVWARLEAGSAAGLRYRAGVFFTGADERAVEAFVARHAENRHGG
jgi:hypothetical protein